MTAPGMPHDWKPSVLGHGELMCARCHVTNREAAAIGLMNDCEWPFALAEREATPTNHAKGEG